MDKDPRVKKKQGCLMGNKERGVWEGMDVSIMEPMKRRSRDSRDKVYANIARVPGADLS